MRYLEDEIRLGPDGQIIRDEARKALEAADCLGVFPTPIDQIMAAADLEEMPEEALDPGLIQSLRRRFGGSLKRALSKVLGVLDAKARLVYVAPMNIVARRAFLRLHEAGHGWIPWHRKMYAAIEECEKTIAPDIADQFDAEANLFASEVLFQLDTFSEKTREEPFGLRAPLKVGRKFGASGYASIRRYVSRHHRCCAVVVLNPPELVPGHGFTATFRRVVASQSFLEQFGDLDFPEVFTPDDQIGKMVPLGNRRMTGRRSLTFNDQNGQLHECVAEAFGTPFQVFVLICPQGAFTRRSIIVPT